MTLTDRLARAREGSDERGRRILEAIYDDVDNRLNPSGDECWYCGGEGSTFDCFDGCCLAADYGCADCTRPCPECRLYASQRAKAVREEVIDLGDIGVAIAWLKDIGRWRDGITDDQVRAQLDEARRALNDKDSSHD